MDGDQTEASGERDGKQSSPDADPPTQGSDGEASDGAADADGADAKPDEAATPDGESTPSEETGPDEKTAPDEETGPDGETAPDEETGPGESTKPGTETTPGDAAPTDDASSNPDPAPAADGHAKPSTRAPRPIRPASRGTAISVAVGLSPDAPGTKEERALLDALQASSEVSAAPPTKVRRLPLGAGSARRVCRQRRDDLVILVGYVPTRTRPVVLAHDCRLDTPLAVRPDAAVHEHGLVPALWNEREGLVRGGMRERRTIAKLSPRARGGIIAGVAIVVVGAAIAILVGTALRKEQVVITVSP